MIEKLSQIARNVYKQMGYGYSEFIYQRAMEAEMRVCGIKYENEKRVTIYYKDSSGIMNSISENRIDLYVYDGSNQILVELKALTGSLSQKDHRQLNRYQEMLSYDNLYPSSGMLINFPKTEKDIEIVEIDFMSRDISEDNIDSLL